LSFVFGHSLIDGARITVKRTGNLGLIGRVGSGNSKGVNLSLKSFKVERCSSSYMERRGNMIAGKMGS